MACLADFVNIPSPVGEPAETSQQDFYAVALKKPTDIDSGTHQTQLAQAQCHQKGARKRKTQGTSARKRHNGSSSLNAANKLQGEFTALSQSDEVTDCHSESPKPSPLFRFVRLENGILNVVPINPTEPVAPNTSECEQPVQAFCSKPTSQHNHLQLKPHRLLSRPKKSRRADRSANRSTSNGVTRKTLSGIKNFPGYADMVVNAQKTLLESMSSYTIKRACMPREVRNVKRKPSTPISISQVTSILNYQDQMNLLLKLEYQHLLRIAEQVQTGVFAAGGNGLTPGLKSGDNFQDWQVLNSCTVTHSRPVVGKREPVPDGMDVVQAALFSTFGSVPTV